MYMYLDHSFLCIKVFVSFCQGKIILAGLVERISNQLKVMCKYFLLGVLEQKIDQPG